MKKRAPTTVGKNLRDYRKAKRLSQMELAALAGIGRSSIALLETGVRRRVVTSTLEKLASALGRSVADLYREPRREQSA